MPTFAELLIMIFNNCSMIESSDEKCLVVHRRVECVNECGRKLVWWLCSGIYCHLENLNVYYVNFSWNFFNYQPFVHWIITINATSSEKEIPHDSSLAYISEQNFIVCHGFWIMFTKITCIIYSWNRFFAHEYSNSVCTDFFSLLFFIQSLLPNTMSTQNPPEIKLCLSKLYNMNGTVLFFFVVEDVSMGIDVLFETPCQVKRKMM